VAPLGATVAATVAVGLGVALARAGRGRLAARRARARELVLRPDEALEQGMQRMALEQLDLALEELGDTEQGPPSEHAVHETRKALKRLRAMFRLLDPALGGNAFVRETDALRESAGRLAGARDAEVMLATLDGLIERHPRKLSRSAGVRRLRAQLAADQEQVRGQTLGDPASLALVLGDLRNCRLRVEAWQLPPGKNLALVEPGLRRLYEQGRRRFRRAASGKGEPVLVMHEWRKRVKDLRYVAEMLQREPTAARSGLPALVGAPPRRVRGHGGEYTKLLRGVARRADELGERLGEDHDLAVLAEHVRRASKKGSTQPRVGRRARKHLLKAISRRRRKLRRRALREGERLYDTGPKQFVGRVRSTERSRAKALSRRSRS